MVEQSHRGLKRRIDSAEEMGCLRTFLVQWLRRSLKGHRVLTLVGKIPATPH